MASLSLKHIYKVYPNGTKAVNDFNMQIEDKEFIVFVGPSGCGKSTTLRMIAGLEDISAGELKIGDTVVNDMQPKDRDIAMVFQNYALYPHMTVYDNIAFGLRLKKMDKEEIHRRVTEAAQILGITDYLGRKPKEMSGGQRQRVSLGRAIVREPKVMLLDEPLSNLDAKLRTQMRAEISKLHTKLNTTFIYVTHDQVEAMTMGTRIVVMKGGFIQQIDTPKNLYDFPKNKFVAGFIGTPQMNFFEATLKKEGERVHMKFLYSDEQISLPLCYFYKVNPRYLEGEKRVYVGVRAEDLSFDEEKIKESAAKIKLKISHVEELGSETLVYGDLNMGGDGYLESSTRAIVKSFGEQGFAPNAVMEVALDVKKIHLFDGETQESILPKIPQSVTVNAEMKGGALLAFGQKISLPSALKCKDCKGELLVPLSAVYMGEDYEAKVESREKVGKKWLYTLILGEERLFLLSQEELSQSVKICFDLKKLQFSTEGKVLFEAMDERVKLYGRLIKEKQRKNGKKRVGFFFESEGARFEVPDGLLQKLFAVMGMKNALSHPLRFECSPYDFTFDKEGILVTVERVLDYGKEQFLLCQTAEGNIPVHAKWEGEKQVRLAPDLSKLSIIDEKLDVRVI